MGDLNTEIFRKFKSVTYLLKTTHASSDLDQNNAPPKSYCGVKGTS